MGEGAACGEGIAGGADLDDRHCRHEPSAGDEESSSAGPNTSSQITESMATFTLMQIFKDQGLYDQALRVLDLLRSSSPNIERIEKEAAEIKQLLIDKQALENK